MYSKDFITTYKNVDDYETSLCLYQSQIIQAFNLKVFDEYKIANQIDKIENELINNIDIINIKKQLLEKYNNSFFNKNNIFTLLFGYEYFNEFHKCYIKNDFSNFII